MSQPRKYDSYLTDEFFTYYRRLSGPVRERARETYERWKKNHEASGLDFKTLATDKSVCQVRIGDHYRATGLLVGNAVHWFWIGTKNDFKKKF